MKKKCMLRLPITDTDKEEEEETTTIETCRTVPRNSTQATEEEAEDTQAEGTTMVVTETLEERTVGRTPWMQELVNCLSA